MSKALVYEVTLDIGTDAAQGFDAVTTRVPSGEMRARITSPEEVRLEMEGF